MVHTRLNSKGGTGSKRTTGRYIAIFCILLCISFDWISVPLTSPEAYGSQTTITYKTAQNIPYRSTTSPGWTSYMEERCRLDLYYPEKVSGFATVVWFHGGGLKSGKLCQSSPAQTRMRII